MPQKFTQSQIKELIQARNKMREAGATQDAADLDKLIQDEIAQMRVAIPAQVQSLDSPPVTSIAQGAKAAAQGLGDVVGGVAGAAAMIPGMAMDAAKPAAVPGKSWSGSPTIDYLAQRAVDPLNISGSLQHGIIEPMQKTAEESRFTPTNVAEERKKRALQAMSGMPGAGPMIAGIGQSIQKPEDITKQAATLTAMYGAPELANMARAPIGRSMEWSGRLAQKYPRLVGGIPGYLLGGEVGHKLLGYFMGKDIAPNVGRNIEMLGTKIRFGGPKAVPPDPHLGPVPGSQAWEVTSAEILRKHPELPPAPPDIAGGQQAGGMLLRERPKIRAEYARFANALTQEVKPGPMQANRYRTHASHAIPEINQYADAVGKKVTGVESGTEMMYDTMDWEWGKQKDFVAQIADKPVSMKGVGQEFINELSKEYNLSNNPGVARRAAVIKKSYANIKNMPVQQLFDEVTRINKRIREIAYKADPEYHILNAQREALLPRLYDAFNENLPPSMMDQAIMSRKNFGSVKDISRGMEKLRGEWIQSGGINNPKGLKSKIDPLVSADEMVARIFNHVPKEPTPVPAHPPITRTPPGQVDQMMGTPAGAPVPSHMPGETFVPQQVTKMPKGTLTKASGEAAKPIEQIELPAGQKLSEDQIMAVLMSEKVGDLLTPKSKAFQQLVDSGLTPEMVDNARIQVTEEGMSARPSRSILETSSINRALERVKGRLTGEPALGMEPSQAVMKAKIDKKTGEAILPKGASPLVKPESALQTESRKLSMEELARREQEGQLGAGRRTKKKFSDAGFATSGGSPVAPVTERILKQYPNAEVKSVKVSQMRDGDWGLEIVYNDGKEARTMWRGSGSQAETMREALALGSDWPQSRLIVNGQDITRPRSGRADVLKNPMYLMGGAAATTAGLGALLGGGKKNK